MTEVLIEKTKKVNLNLDDINNMSKDQLIEYILNTQDSTKLPQSSTNKLDNFSDKKYLTVEEVAKILNLSTSRTYTLMKEIPHHQPSNGRILVDKDDLDKWIKRDRNINNK